MLRSLRLQLVDRPDLDLSFEPQDDETDPWKLLMSQVDGQGLISIGDRESCTIADVLGVVVVEPKPLEGPTFEHGLQDEDAATALEENYDPP